MPSLPIKDIPGRFCVERELSALLKNLAKNEQHCDSFEEKFLGDLSFAKIKHFAHLFGFGCLADSRANIVTKNVLRNENY